MTDQPADPVKPPPGGYNDFHPPPAPPRLDKQGYVRRIRSGINAPGAAWRLCEITQPRSIHELVAHVWPEPTPVSAEVGIALADAFSDWVNAGKPAAHP